MTKEVYAVGSETFVTGFRLSGVKKAIAVEGQAYQDEVVRLLDAGEAGIMIVHSSDVARLPAPLRRKMSESIDPVVIQMGEASSSDLRDKVKRAIGLDLYKE
ncbi:MAG: V-type ATP synthase subunit F [Euryarchaeota archaeon]|nr:V-type ATP synthase subunit F [Euryarchaeota archaeon]